MKYRGMCTIEAIVYIKSFQNLYLTVFFCFVSDRTNNFPPFPSFCPVQPCFFHDINTDIPPDYQRTCRMLFYCWQCEYCIIYYITATVIINRAQVVS